METIKDTVYNKTIDDLALQRADELRREIVNMTRIIDRMKQELADLEPDETKIKDVRHQAAEARRRAEETTGRDQQETETPTDESPTP